MLRNRRRKRGLNQSQLAKRLRINKSYLSRLERKVEGYHPSLDLIVKISKELECCPIKFFLFFAEIDCKYFNPDNKKQDLF